MRRIAGALLLASLTIPAPRSAVCAEAQAAAVFQPVETPVAAARSHTLAYVTAATGVALIAASFPLADAADRRYDEYLTESDPSAIDRRYDAVVRADRLASSSLLAGEVLLATGIWLRFVRRAPSSRLTWTAGPSRCAVHWRF